MDSLKSGTSTSACKVTGINDLGFWVLVENKEYFIPFSDFPGFKDSTVSQILTLQFYPPSQLHWPNIDIDIEIDSLLKPESFPLIFK